MSAVHPILGPDWLSGRYEVRDCGHDTPCWVWSLCCDRNGYGHVKIRGRGESPQMAHRVAYETLVGPIPGGHEIDHLCRNRACVNPEHLEAVTPTENTRRRVDLVLSEDLADEIRRSPESTRQAARRLGVSQAAVWSVRAGRTWKVAA